MFGAIIKSRMMKGKGEPEMETPPPMTCVSSEHLPEIKNWKVGETYDLKFRMVSREEKEDGSVHADFELDGKKSDKKEEDYEDEE